MFSTLTFRRIELRLPRLPELIFKILTSNTEITQVIIAQLAAYPRQQTYAQLGMCIHLTQLTSCFFVSLVYYDVRL